MFCFWAYVSGYFPFMSSDLFTKLCLLALLHRGAIKNSQTRIQESRRKAGLKIGTMGGRIRSQLLHCWKIITPRKVKQVQRMHKTLCWKTMQV